MKGRHERRPVASPAASWLLRDFPWSGGSATAARDGTDVWIGGHQ
jgi:hypothetical protein